MMRWTSIAAACGWLLAGCEGDARGHLIAVDLRTDFVPRLEFEQVRVELIEPEDGRPSARIRSGVTVAAGDDYLDPRRVAELDRVARGQVFVRVQLLGASSAVLAERPALVTVTDDVVVLVVITRSCLAVVCPGPADPPGAIACTGGRCVEPECGTPGAPPCPRDCTTAADCPASPVACVEARCTGDGVCLSAARDDRCAAGQVCDPRTGCVGAPPPRDAGPVTRDAGPLPRDAGPGDAGPPAVPCAAADCSGCRAESGCAWCQDDMSCGPDNFTRRDTCSDWRAQGTAICACQPVGGTCSANEHCCSTISGAPARPTRECHGSRCCTRAGGGMCTTDSDCCGTYPGRCGLGFCRCTPTGQPCGPSDDCCDGPCSGGVCTFG